LLGRTLCNHPGWIVHDDEVYLIGVHRSAAFD
jgi:hypothetical protein